VSFQVALLWESSAPTIQSPRVITSGVRACMPGWPVSPRSTKVPKSCTNPSAVWNTLELPVESMTTRGGLPPLIFRIFNEGQRSKGEKGQVEVAREMGIWAINLVALDMPLH
jgi:hypothetical protein